MKKIIIVLIFLTFFNINVYANTKEKVTLVKCVDGDTASFKVNGETIKVRFLAIDTPETVHPTKEAEAYGKNAKEYTCNKLTNAKKIELEYDDKSTKYDKYNRLLAWIWVDEKLLQEELIVVGYAKVKYVYGKYSHLDILYQKEEEAKNKNLGVWKDYIPVTYIVTFNYNGETKEIKVNENETVKSFTPKKEGHKFIGWFYANSKFDFNTKITSNLELEAKFEKNISIIEIIMVILILLALYIINPKKFKKIIKKKVKK